MILKILKKDILRNKVITATLFFFIMLAAALLSSALMIVGTLTDSVDDFFACASAPHYTQMYCGEFSQTEIDFFSENSSLVEKQQTVKMIGISGSHIYLGDRDVSESASIIENSFVKQNRDFDFLLDMENNIVSFKEGEIGVPVYHMQQYQLEIGDKVRIEKSDFSMEFVITAFIRDVQMNPSIVTSKRFAVSDHDFQIIEQNMGEPEYLIEFQLYDVNKINEFESMYQASGLPQEDTVITYSLYKILNAMTDGIIAAVIILISILLGAVAMLCLHYTLSAVIEEDYREIGVMKAVGISRGDLKKIYLVKYVLMAILASALGYILSGITGNILISDIVLYMGKTETTGFQKAVPFLGALIVFSAVTVFCRIVLGKFDKVSPVWALRERHSNGVMAKVKKFPLYKSFINNVNIHMGLKAVINKFSSYGILCVVFAICTFLMIVPINFLNTVNSPDFVSYMGAGRGDIRIDLQKGNALSLQLEAIENFLDSDKEISQYSSFTTAIFKAENSEGLYENIKIESGDFSLFPLTYLKGRSPQRETEIVLSAMNSEELGKTLGDFVKIQNESTEYLLEITGIYQDVTNGGKTAKALLPYDKEDIQWIVINIEVKDGVLLNEKIEKLRLLFPEAKITDMGNYVAQTLSGLINQLKITVCFGVVLALATAILITAMFFRMLIAKETSQIAIMKSLGVKDRDIKVQYFIQAAAVLVCGILLGMFCAHTVGQSFAGFLISGISSLKFNVNPVLSFIICPAVLLGAVTITLWISSTRIKKISIMSFGI